MILLLYFFYCFSVSLSILVFCIYFVNGIINVCISYELFFIFPMFLSHGTTNNLNVKVGKKSRLESLLVDKLLAHGFYSTVVGISPSFKCKCPEIPSPVPHAVLKRKKSIVPDLDS